MIDALLVAAVCLAGEAFFAASEAAIIALDRARADRGGPGVDGRDRFLADFLERPQRLLATTLLGRAMCVLVSTVTLALALAQRHPAAAPLYALLALAPSLVVLGEIVPRSIAQQHAERLAPRLARPLWIASLVFQPLVSVLTGITSWVSRRLGVELSHKFVTREDLELILKNEPQKGSEITEGERKMIARIFDFGDLRARDVMVSLSSLTALDETTPIEEVLREVEDKGFSRYPVYRERIDQIAGVVQVFDLLKAGRKAASLAEVMREPLFVPEGQPAIDLLVELQRRRQAMAVVVDEYGGAVGVVTIEDILEEIVGPIDDEHDVAEAPIRREADDLWRVRGQTPVREVNRVTGAALPEGDDYETLGGLLLDRLKRIPRAGETVREGEVVIRVTAANERVIEEVQLRVAPKR